MWRRTKPSLDTTRSQEGAPSEKLSPSHRLARTLLKPFSRKSRPEALPQRTKSDTHLTHPNPERKLTHPNPERNLRLSKSLLDEPTETRAGENMERAPKVETREVRKLSTPQFEIEEMGVVSGPGAADVSAAALVTSATRAADISTSALVAGAAGAADISTTAPVTRAAKADVPLPPEAEGLPEDVVNDLVAAFKYFDHNSDGCIDKEELGAVLRSLGDSPTDAELSAMIAAVDQNGDGSICLGEFLNLNKMALEKGLAGDEDTELRATFDVFDLDKNGFISCEELQQVLSRLLGEPVVHAECSRMIKGVDRDGDGQVNFQEFHTMMQQALPC